MRLTHYCWTGMVLLLMTTVSCKKDVPDNKFPLEKDASRNAQTLACGYGMIGYYGDAFQTDTVSILPYVSNSVVSLNNSPFWGTYWTSIHTWTSIPTYCYLLPNTIGDTLNFSVRLKNPSFGSGSVSAWDVGLFMVGEQNTAGVSIIGNTQNQQYTYLKVGQTGVSNQSSLVRVFNDWAVVTLRAAKIPNSSLYSLSVLIDGSLIQSINYDLVNGIGQISRFEIAFKGSGSVDWFRVSGSNSGTGLLRNEFDNVSGYGGGLQWF